MVRNRGLRWWAIGTFLVLWAWVAVVITPQNLTPSAGPFETFSYFDFRDTVWIPVQDFWAGGVPWDTPSYLARHPGVQNFVLYMPWYFYPAYMLKALPYSAAVVIWLGISTASLVFLAWASLKFAVPDALKHRPWLVAIVGLCLVLSRSERSALFQGQWALICSAAAAFLLVCTRESARTVTAIVLVLVKPPVGLPVVACMFIRRFWRSILVALGIATVLVAPLAVITISRLGGLGQAAMVFRRNIGAGYTTSFGGVPTRIDVLGTLSASGLTPYTGGSVVLLCVTALSLLGGYYIASRCSGAQSVLAVTFGSLSIILITPNVLYAAPVVLPAILGHMRTACDRNGVLLAIRVFSGFIATCLVIPQLVPGSTWRRLGLSEIQSAALGGWFFAAAAILAWLLLIWTRHYQPHKAVPAVTD